MKTIVFIGSHKSGSSREAIKAAERMGYFTVLLTDQKNFLIKRTDFPDVMLMELCNLTNLDEIRNHLQELKLRSLIVSAIVSFVDPHCYTASFLSEEHDLIHFSTQAIHDIQDKIHSRKILSTTSYSTWFTIITADSSVNNTNITSLTPSIMKSPRSEGSKDVYLIRTLEDFNKYKNRLFKKYPDSPILLEEYIDGPQYLVESLIFDGEIHIVAVIRQEITFTYNHFIITGYQLLIDMPSDFYEHLKVAVESVIRTHGLELGPCHLELRYLNGEWKLIELNPRISGGGMNRLIEIGLGVNLVEETLKLSLGQQPNVKPRHNEQTFAHYIVLNESGILEKVTGKKKAWLSPGVKQVYVKPHKGAALTPPLSMGNRYAYAIATGTSEEEAEKNAKYATSHIQFHLSSPVMDESQPSQDEF